MDMTQETKLWGSRRYIQAAFGLSRRQLWWLVNKGRIRTAKLGEHLQSRRLYRIADVEAALEATSQ